MNINEEMDVLTSDENCKSNWEIGKKFDSVAFAKESKRTTEKLLTTKKKKLVV